MEQQRERSGKFAATSEKSNGAQRDNGKKDKAAVENKKQKSGKDGLEKPNKNKI